jgi:DNA-directed RNA polymerase II subunit RPB1
LSEEVIKNLREDAQGLSEIELEWKQLCEDRSAIRQVFPSGNSKIVLPCNLQRLIWNAQKIFRIDTRKVTELHPIKIIEGVYCWISTVL